MQKNGPTWPEKESKRPTGKVAENRFSELSVYYEPNVNKKRKLSLSEFDPAKTNNAADHEESDQNSWKDNMFLGRIKWFSKEETKIEENTYVKYLQQMTGPASQ